MRTHMAKPPPRRPRQRSAEDIQPRRARTTLPGAWRPRPLRRPAPRRRPRPGDPDRRPNWGQHDNRRSAARRPYPLAPDTGRRRSEVLLLQGGTARTVHLAGPGPVARGPFQGHRHDPSGLRCPAHATSGSPAIPGEAGTTSNRNRSRTRNWKQDDPLPPPQEIKQADASYPRRCP
jgi:hypothetical protein